ncbi:MAG: hypothetical protein CBC24_05305 [Candidatus Pelagibacter sp. TMED64]|nr:hypothetical protein [Candidatus Pelagibacter sp.]OUU65543.1 MAG: hypothetical protein CBC24_05305 [Candidatus Pelagibacter sp. TMED64]|tara:strand:- start:23064 stop:23474 length:411 start_codon:yes stop_codon:yes gene_type:complete
MRILLAFIIILPLVEIYLMIKVGTIIGTLNTLILIIFTAIVGVYYARIEGINTLRSGISQLIQNQTPVYELISGATIAFAAVMLIFPGFMTDILGFILIFPITRKILIHSFSSKFKKEKTKVNDENIIDIDSEDIK